jgi:hypothetical protein
MDYSSIKVFGDSMPVGTELQIENLNESDYKTALDILQLDPNGFEPSGVHRDYKKVPFERSQKYYYFLKTRDIENNYDAKSSFGGIVAKHFDCPVEVYGYAGYSNTAILNTMLSTEINKNDLLLVAVTYPWRTSQFITDHWKSDAPVARCNSITHGRNKEHNRYSELDMLYGNDMQSKLHDVVNYINTIKTEFTNQIIFIDIPPYKYNLQKYLQMDDYLNSINHNYLNTKIYDNLFAVTFDDVWDELKINCRAPLGHPNTRAHSRFADHLIEYIIRR